ncbi:MAG: glycosyltransferase [Bacteroidales bacterium]|nr:glycosyltransferase [Bacteroidales bacterium]
MENKGESLVSVIIPTYKCPITLDRAINSVLVQTYTNIEIIVVDDNNPETEGRLLTEAKMLLYENNPRLHYIKHSHNKGGSAARNTGARFSNSTYLAFLDDDDEFLPNKIQSQVEILETKGAEWAVCYSRYYSKKENGKPVESREHEEGYLYIEALSQKICLAAGSNLLIKREAFESVGGFDETFIRNQDHEILTKLLKRYKIAYSAEPGLIVHVHAYDNPINYELVIEKYINNFQSDIDELSSSDRRYFYQSINKSRFYYFLRNDHNYKKCIKMIIKRDIRIVDFTSLLFTRGTTVLKGRLKL